MSDNLKNIDQLFKQELGKSKLQVPSGAWEAIASKAGIAGSGSVIVAKSLIWAKVSGVLVTAVTIGVGVYVYVQTPRDKEIEVNTPKVMPLVEDNANAVSPNENEVSFKLEPNINPKMDVARTLVEKPVQKVEKSVELKFNEPSIDPKITVLQPIKMDFDKPKVKEEVKITRLADLKEDKNEISKTPSPKQFEVTKTQDVKMLRVFPDIFTPNSDGTNDSFYVEIDKPELFQLIIRTKQGVILFNTLDVNEKWDGKFNGVELPNGEYMASLVYQFAKTDRVITKTKTIELKRTE